MNYKRSNFLKVTFLLILISIIFTVISKSVYVNIILKQNNSIFQTRDLTVNKVTVLSSNKKVYDTYDKSNNELLNYAYSFLGKPYIYGESGPNAFDCSGFTKFVYKYFSKDLPRTSKEQYNSGIKVQRKDLQTGDLVFFNIASECCHVGIYIGNGNFIHASSSKGVSISSINNKYYNDKYYGAARY